MKEQQPLNLDGRKELGKLEMTKEVVYTLNGMGILAFFAFGFFFTSLYTLLTGNIGFNFTSGTILISVALFIGTLVLHELIHGAFMSKYGGKPSYGAGIAHFILPYLYTTTKTVFPRNQFIVIAIAPLVVISLGVMGIMAAFPSIAHWMFIPFVLNASGAVGDLWVTRNILRYPKHVLLEDQKNGLIIYGKETDKPLNISTTGFASGFSKVFILCIVATGFTMSIAPMTLDILGVESFTIGPTNSVFTIYEYHSIGEGFEFGFFPMSLLAISVIGGLVYAIVKTSKPSVAMARKNPEKFGGKCPERRFMGLCIGIGLAIGAGIGVAMDNIGAGMGVGFVLGVGVAIDSAMEAKVKKEGKIRSLKNLKEQ